jgi:acyl carrier protein
LIKGRKDFQIKINGQRTEPGAIESEIIKHPSIITARVFQFVHKKNTVLSCIYTTRKPIIEKDIQLFLKGKLSDYMIPHFFFNANKISLGSTEKFDFNEVKSMAIKSYVKTVGKNPNKLNANVRNNLDSILLNKLKEIVDIKQISIHTNFKSCGMDSLKYISLISILKEMGIKVEYEDIFKTNNVQELSDLISFRHPAVSLIGRFKHKSLLNKYVESYSMQNTRIEKVNKRQNVLITGGNGFLGTHLIYKLLKLKRNVYCPIRANNKSLAIRKLQDGMTQFSKNAIKQIMDLLDKRLFIIPITNYTEPF